MGFNPWIPSRCRCLKSKPGAGADSVFRSVSVIKVRLISRLCADRKSSYTKSHIINGMVTMADNVEAVMILAIRSASPPNCRANM